MSGFITSTGLDLDSIFQLKPPAITDASGILIGQLIFDGIETDPLGLLIVPSTGFKVKKTVPIVSFVDFADRYRKKDRNTYALNTGFRTSNNLDLSTLFEWGDYDPSFSSVILTKTGRSATIEVTGNYYAIDISSNSNRSGLVARNPYTFSDNALFNTNVTFTVRIYNGLFRNVQERIESVTTIESPVFSSITLVSVADGSLNSLNFSFVGQRYSMIRYSIGNGGGVFTANTPLVPPTTVKIPNPTNDASFNIFFTPYNEYEENGVSTTKKIRYKSQLVESINFNTVLTQNTPAYLYSADFLVVGAGASGGSGGAKRSGTGGNGGAGGSGGYNSNNTGIVFDGTNVVRSVSYTCGKGGDGVNGVGAGPINGSGNNGNNGNPGSMSSIVIPNFLRIDASGGTQGGGGASGGSNASGGAGGYPNGVAGVGMQGGVLPYTGYTSLDVTNNNGSGSNGGGGAGSGGSGNTEAGKNGFTQAKFYYVEMT